MTKPVYISGIALAFVILVFGAVQISKRSSRNHAHVSEEPTVPTTETQPRDRSLGLRAAQAAATDPVPGNAITITLLDMKAIETDDGGATGDGDEVYVQVFRGVGINERYFEKIELASIKPGQTIAFNKTLYEGPRVQLPDITYVALDFWDGDDVSSDDHLGGPVYIYYQNNGIVFGPGTARVCTQESPASVMCKYEIDGKDDKYEMSFRAVLH